MHVNSYAKVNLYLKIGKKLKSGYHNIQSVMQLVKLHDAVSFERLDDNDIEIETTAKNLENKDNLAYKAALLLKNRHKARQGIRIKIEKNIPIAAGLGGGSSNAACTLIALNKLWGLKLEHKKLIGMASSIGSDVPFFIEGKTALVEGTGNKVKPLKKTMSMNIVLVNPGIKVSTTWAYKQLDKGNIKNENKKDIKELIKAVNRKDIKKIAENIHNDFDATIEKKYKAVKEIKTSFRKFDSLGSMVVGSGPTVLGLFESIYTAREAYFKLKDLYPFVYLTKTF